MTQKNLKLEALYEKALKEVEDIIESHDDIANLLNGDVDQLDRYAREHQTMEEQVDSCQHYIRMCTRDLKKILNECALLNK